MIRALLHKLRYFLSIDTRTAVAELPRVDIGTQQLLAMQYRALARSGEGLPSFDDVGFSEFSGSNEDGILLFIFSLIGHGNREFVDIGAAGVRGSNVANLIVNHGWHGTLIDANPDRLAIGNAYYSSRADIWRYPPKSIREFVTMENVNQVLSQQGVSEKIDLLSIDIDGMDYWIWKTIDCVSPRVVVVEYSDIIGPDRSVTVPYDAHFNQQDYDVNESPFINYAGASLRAFVNLATEKGYRLVGCTRYGLNAFFMRNDVGDRLFPEIPIGDCFKHPRTKFGMEERWPKVANMEWIEV